MTQATLYERLGSEPGIRTFVTDILKLHHQNPVIKWRYSKAEKTDAALIDLVVDLVASGTGGPQTYKGMDMRAAHKGMWCSEEEFLAVLDDIRKAMEMMGHPESEPKLVGRNIFMTLVPLPPGKRKRHFFGPHDMVLRDEPEEGDEEIEDDTTGKNGKV